MSDRAEEEAVRFEIDCGTARIYFNRPEKRNGMSPRLSRRMKQVLETRGFREDVGVLVLVGEGSALTAGMHRREYSRTHLRDVAGGAPRWWSSISTP